MVMHSESQPQRYAEPLKAARQRRGMSQAEVARALEVTQQSIARWEAGQQPQPRYQRRIDEFLRAPGPGEVIPFPTPSGTERSLTERQGRAVDSLVARSATGAPMTPSDVAAFRALFLAVGLEWRDAP